MADLQPASLLVKQSNQIELDRKEYWRKFHQEVDKDAISKIAELVKTDSAIYWRHIDCDIRIGDATRKYLTDMGYKLSTSPYSIHNTIIKW